MAGGSKKDAKPRLLIATDNFLPRWDGIARFLAEVIPRLLDDFRISVVAPHFGPVSSEISRNLQLIRIPVLPVRVGDFNPSKLSLSAMVKIRKAVRSADIVWTQTIGPLGFFSLRTAHRYKKPLLSFVHSIEWDLVRMALSRHNLLRRPVRMLTKILARNTYNKCDRLMVPSHEVSEILEVNGIFPPKDVVLLGVDSAKFVPPSSKSAAKEKIGINPDKKVIGYCGRIAREKDLKTLFRAFLRLSSKRSDAVLLLVGTGVRDFDKIINSHSNIIAVGKKDDVVPYLQAMDVYVLPSLLETTSLSSLEAMSCGVPVVCTPVGLLQSYIRDRFNGMFFRKGNSLILSMKLEWLLSHSSVLKEMGVNARKTASELYTWDRTAGGVRSVLKEHLSFVKP
ncbi:glycosyltransferase family 1 protein [Candidatus Woesearchaeota archaeon]|nr:MAG: glycosyltransferase family 1 protein [Candidatus Woesearchaeota archaeon]